MAVTINTENFRQYKNRFPLIVEQILALASHGKGSKICLQILNKLIDDVLRYQTFPFGWIHSVWCPDNCSRGKFSPRLGLGFGLGLGLDLRFGTIFLGGNYPRIIDFIATL